LNAASLLATHGLETASQPEVLVVIITGKRSANSKAFYLDKGANGFSESPLMARRLSM
jgi:hypothetical protein